MSDAAWWRAGLSSEEHRPILRTTSLYCSLSSGVFCRPRAYFLSLMSAMLRQMDDDKWSRLTLIKPAKADHAIIKVPESQPFLKTPFLCFPLPYSCFHCFRFEWSPKCHLCMPLRSTFDVSEHLHRAPSLGFGQASHMPAFPRL